jgi:hypothetical protein
MIDPYLRFEGFDAASWTKMVSLFAPGVIDRVTSEPAESDAPEHGTLAGIEGPKGTLIVVVDADNRVLRATHSLTGRVTGIPDAPSSSVRALATAYAASRVVWLRRGAMEEVMERLSMRLRPGDDYGRQWLVLAHVMRELGQADQLRVWPNAFANAPIPSPAMVERALDVVLPNNTVALAVLWERGEPWTSIAIRRRQGKLDWVAGPDLISSWTGQLGGDWRRDLRVVAGAVSSHMAPVHVGIFAEVETIRSLLREPDAGRWAAATATREVEFYPTPPYVAVALGADVVRAGAKEAATWLGAMGILETLAPLTTALRAQVSNVASVTSALGFNPLQAFGAHLRGEDGTGAAPAATPDSLR